VIDFLAAFGLAFGVVLLVELPDKTLVATLVLATRYRHRPVLIGVAAAFAVQCVIAAIAGRLLYLLPKRAVEAAVAVLFAIGAVLLIRESLSEPAHAEIEEITAARAATSGWRVALTSFGVLFAAEWGDASQIATAGLVARQGEAVAVALGAWTALVSVAAIAVGAGKLLVRRVPVRIVHRVTGGLFAALALLAASNAIRG
jgi:putative Ca2+/H+ antiporter (TMEM165/GDT1 family)